MSKDLGNLKKPASAYRRAIALDPEDAKIYLRLGNTLNAMGNSEEALDVYRSTLSEAVEDLKKAIHINPELRKEIGNWIEGEIFVLKRS
jgi:tetratricopeptide (TPR) repeat protein